MFRYGWEQRGRNAGAFRYEVGQSGRNACAFRYGAGWCAAETLVRSATELERRVPKRWRDRHPGCIPCFSTE
ncbi:MAG: hypothetical protein Fues2KO_43390 [Fuerstiella sp.]